MKKIFFSLACIALVVTVVLTDYRFIESQEEPVIEQIVPELSPVIDLEEHTEDTDDQIVPYSDHEDEI